MSEATRSALRELADVGYITESTRSRMSAAEVAFALNQSGA